MTNISAAKSALRAELAHVQAGLSYYQERVEALSDAITQLDTIEEEVEVELEQPGKKRKGRPRVAREKVRGARGRKPVKAARASKTASRLPATGGDFFPGLLSDRKQSARELLQAATAQLPFKPTAEERAQLRSRMIAALSAMLKSGKIGSEGQGRQRTYFTA